MIIYDINQGKWNRKLNWIIVCLQRWYYHPAKRGENKMPSCNFIIVKTVCYRTSINLRYRMNFEIQCQLPDGKNTWIKILFINSSISMALIDRYLLSNRQNSPFYSLWINLFPHLWRKCWMLFVLPTLYFIMLMKRYEWKKD